MSIWLFTFLLHSTAWFGLAWVSTRLVPRLHPQTRETIWYTAIAISLVTPSIQVLAPDSLPSLWQLTLPGALFPSLEPNLLVGEHGTQAQASRFGLTWEIALLGVWFSIAGVLLARYLMRIVILRRRLTRQNVDVDSPEWSILQDLSRRAGLSRTPRLTESEYLGSPIAIGVGAHAEICVPTRALHELDREEFTAMLGHEIAHHQRRDPVRLGVMNILRSLFFFQPMFNLAGRDVHWAAEEQCDALAAEHVQDRVAVARCLTEVAGWVLPRERSVPVVGMAGGRSHLVRRVDRLIEEQGETKVRGGSWQRLWSVPVLVLAPFIAPGLSQAVEHPVQAVDTGEEHRGEVGGRSHESRDEHSAEGRTEAKERHGTEGPDRSDGEHGER